MNIQYYNTVQSFTTYCLKYVLSLLGVEKTLSTFALEKVIVDANKFHNFKSIRI
jgi:hypothetical protein